MGRRFIALAVASLRSIHPSPHPSFALPHLISVECDLEFLSLGGCHGSCYVICAPGKESNDVGVELSHLETLEVGGEGDLGIVGLDLGGELGDLGLALGSHVVGELLHVLETIGSVDALDGEGGGEDVGQLGSVSVAASGGLLVVVLEVGSGKEVPEDELRDIAVVLLVLYDGDTLSVVLDGDGVGSSVNDNVELVHGVITLLVVGGVDEDLVEDLEKTGDEGDLLLHESASLGVKNKHLVLHHLGGTNVSIRTEEDVLELSLLLVHLLDGLLSTLLSCSLVGRAVLIHHHGSHCYEGEEEG